MIKRTGYFFALVTVIAALVVGGCSSRDVKTSSTKKPSTSSSKKTPVSAKDKSKKDTANQASKPASTGNPELDRLLGALNPQAASGEQKAVAGIPITSSGDVKPSAPPTIPKPGQRPTPQQLLAAVEAAHRSAQQVRAHGITSRTVKQDGKVADQVHGETMEILFKRPNKIKMTADDAIMCSDGKTVYLYDTKAKQYIKQPMKDEVMQELIMSKPGIGLMGLLMGADYSKALTSLELHKDAKIHGHEVYVLSMKLKEGVAVPKGVSSTQTLWIGKQDFAIYKNEVVSRIKPQAPKDYRGKVPKLIESVVSSTIDRFERNPKLSDSEFHFKPPSGAKHFELPKPVDLTDKHAPDISFTWTDGTKKKLSEFRGRVVVLTFWALPMCEKHLPVMQKLADQQDEDVVLVNVNVNMQREEVEKRLKEKDFNFASVYADESLAESVLDKYRPMGMPAIYVIDKQGIVRRAIMGPATLEDLNAKIDKIKAMAD